jgi:hypothetical protein
MYKAQKDTSYWIISQRAIEADHERVFPSKLRSRPWFGSLFFMSVRNLVLDDHSKAGRR